MAVKTHYRTCNLCEAMCGIKIETEGNSIKSIKGDEQDPFSKGYICPKAVALQDIYEDPDRLKKPIKKTTEGWQEISWKEAFDLVEAGIKSVQKQHGMDAIGIYNGNPNVHNLGSMLFSNRFLKPIKTKNRFSATSVDQLPHHFVSQLMIGHSFMLPIPDIDRTMYFLVFGANPMASNGSIMSAAGMPHRIKALQARNGKMVVIDPRKSETAQKADQHIFIKPGTDVFLLAALLHQLLYHEDLPELPEYYKGIEAVKTLFSAYTPELCSQLTGVDAAVIKQMATDFCKAESAVAYGRIGVSIQEHGTLCQWMIYLMNIVTGNFDQAGGMMFTLPALDVVMGKPKGTMYSYNRWQSRVRGLPEFGNELPAAVMAEEMLTPGEGQIKAFICNAGNPVLSTPNGQQLEKGLESLEFMVSIDIYLNETSRFADIILPPATGLEVSHYDVIFNALAVRNTTKYSPALFPKPKGSLYDWEIFKELGKRFGYQQSFIERLIDRWITPEFMLNEGLKRGPYKLSLDKLKKQPHGIDLGALQSVLPKRIFTPDRKVDLSPPTLVEAFKKINPQESNTNGQLLLIGRRHLRSNNSWMHNSKRLVKGPERCTLLIHPDNAKALNIQNEDLVYVSGAGGKVQISAEISDTMMPGVVSIPHGWGHHRQGTGWKIAEAHAGVSINDITDHAMVDPVSGNAAVNGVPVQLEKF